LAWTRRCGYPLAAKAANVAGFCRAPNADVDRGTGYPPRAGKPKAWKRPPGASVHYIPTESPPLLESCIIRRRSGTRPAVDMLFCTCRPAMGPGGEPRCTWEQKFPASTCVGRRQQPSRPPPFCSSKGKAARRTAMPCGIIFVRIFGCPLPDNTSFVMARSRPALVHMAKGFARPRRGPRKSAFNFGLSPVTVYGQRGRPSWHLAATEPA